MRVAIDVDEVLTRTNDYFLREFNEEHGTEFKREDITDYNYLWVEKEGFNRDYVFGKLVEYVRNDLDSYDIGSDIVDVLSNLKNLGHELFILTSRDDLVKERTIEWLEKSFGKGFFDEMVFTGDAISKTICKSEVCKIHEFDVLIEDAPHYCQEVSKAGVKVLMMDCPWNRDVKESENLIRVNNWKEVFDFLNS